jgi:hypothetical protein
MNSNKEKLENQQFVHRIGDSYDEFVQVLIDHFILSRDDNGKMLQFEIHNNTMAIRDPKARYLLNQFIGKCTNKEKVRKLLKKIAEFEKDKNLLSYQFDATAFPFRYANGGVLPIIKVRKKDYFCLFYRAVFPVGWNIANGAANNIDDIRNPVKIIHREFSEEFIIADHDNKILYIFDSGDNDVMVGTQETAYQLWNDRLNLNDLSKYERKSIPLKWILGNDKLRFKYGKDQFSYDGFFVNITPEDNAIELDKIALINLTGKFSFYDGEVGFISDEEGNTESFLLNRIIGFFPVNKFLNNLGNNLFEPEFFYHSGKKYPGKYFKSILKEEYLKLHCKSGFRSRNQHKKYLETVRSNTDLDLCPITRAITEKYYQWLKAEKQNILMLKKESGVEPKGLIKVEAFDIFISFKSRDQQIAELLYDFLRKRGFGVFCSSKSIKLLGTSEYSKAIDNALQQSKCLVLIGSDLASFESGWIDYEWRTFQMLLLSNSKKGELFTFTKNIDPHDLPLGLQTRENIRFSENSLELSFNNLLGYIENAMENT